MSELTPALVARFEMRLTLTQCERLIEQAQVAYVSAGHALAEIRDRKLCKKSQVRKVVQEAQAAPLASIREEFEALPAGASRRPAHGNGGARPCREMTSPTRCPR